VSPAFVAPRTLAEAYAHLAEGARPVVLAGGTDLWPQWTASGVRPARVMSLHRIEALGGVEALGDGWIRLGATCTHARLRDSELVRRACPALAAAAATVGAIQVQSQGTLGGNLVNASPAADLPPALMVAGAEVELGSVRGVRRVPLAMFYRAYREVDRQPDELLVAVRALALPHDAREHFRKVGTRRAQAISKVVGAARLAVGSRGLITRAMLALGSVGPVTLRLSSVEAWLMGKPVGDEATALEAEAMTLEAVRPMDDVRSTALYRSHVCGRLVHGWLMGRDRV